MKHEEIVGKIQTLKFQLKLSLHCLDTGPVS